MRMPQAVLLWFRQDLRLFDNPALHAAMKENLPIIPVFIWDPKAESNWAPGRASQVWLNGSLASLQANLKILNSVLIIQKGDTLAQLIAIAKATSANRIHCNQRYEPSARKQQRQLQLELTKEGFELTLHTGGTLLWEPDDVKTQEGKPYQVFTAFFKRCLENIPHFDLLPKPKQLKLPSHWPDSVKLKELHLLPQIAWDAEIKKFWTPGEESAQQALQQFISYKQSQYSINRDLPAIEGTSRLSAALHFGEISPRQIWAEITAHSDRAGSSYLREIAWREFAYHILYHFPHTTEQPLKEKFQSFTWNQNSALFEKWCQGKTGYPIVDAGMRQLWRIGWMHNRLRMIVGSFLTKDLLISWQDGARWFWDTLVDADLANNTLGWQWVSGCGADAQPFFRIFNPVMQSKKFDPNGDYIRLWIPELAKLPPKYIHEPWTAPAIILKDSGITLGQNYPKPIVNHAKARAEALKRFQQVKVNSEL